MEKIARRLSSLIEKKKEKTIMVSQSDNKEQPSSGQQDLHSYRNADMKNKNDDFGELIYPLLEICKFLGMRLEDLKKEHIMRERLTYEDVIRRERLTCEDIIRYFVENSMKDPRISKGAMLKQYCSPQGYIVTQIFLDKNSKPVVRTDGSPYKRTLLVEALDSELLDVFGDKELVIVE